MIFDEQYMHEERIVSVVGEALLQVELPLLRMHDGHAAWGDDELAPARRYFAYRWN